MSLAARIEGIRRDIRGGSFLNEAAVSQGVVLPLLDALGWPVFSTDVVAPQYTVEGRRVDYALCHPPGKPIAFVEVKRVGQSEGADRQLFEYAFHLGVPLAVLTDGQEWHVYLPAAQGLYQERRVYKLDLLERDVAESESRLKRYLGFDAVSRGDALRAAHADYQDAARLRQIRATLPVAWKRLMEEPEEVLVELVTDQVESLCGFRPDPDTVVAFLKGGPSPSAGSRAAPTRSAATAPPSSPTAPPAAPTADGFGFVLNGTFWRAKSAREVLVTVFLRLQERDSSFFERFAALPKHGRSRRFLARSALDLYPGRPDLAESHSHELLPGWWIGTNYGVDQIRKIIGMASEVAGLRFGCDLVVKFE